MQIDKIHVDQEYRKFGSRNIAIIIPYLEFDSVYEMRKKISRFHIWAEFVIGLTIKSMRNKMIYEDS